MFLLASSLVQSQYWSWPLILVVTLAQLIDGAAANQSTIGSSAPINQQPNNLLDDWSADNSRQVTSSRPHLFMSPLTGMSGTTTTTTTTTSTTTMTPMTTTHRASKDLVSQSESVAIDEMSARSQAKLVAQAREGRPKARYTLPSWFNYQLYKQFHGKKYPHSAQNEAHKRIYLRTALKVFEQRALYRVGRLSSLSSVNELSDLVSLFGSRSNRRAQK